MSEPRPSALFVCVKNAGKSQMAAALTRLHAGDSVVAPSTTRRLLEHFARTAPPSYAGASAALDGLTEREVEVLRHVGRGRTNGEIAEDLVVAEATVKTHVVRLLAKTGSRDRVQAVLFAFRAGLVGREDLLAP